MLRSFQFWRTLLVSKQSKPLQPSKVTDRGLAMFCSWKSEQYKDHFEAGKYVCSKCNHDLFTSKSKYQHSSPWPAFTETIAENSLSKYEESPGALKVSCGKCGQGLGHEFLRDGPNGKSRF